MLGDELIQYGDVAPLGGGRWQLSRLLRGRRGTEAAMVGHVAGEMFVLVEAESLLPIEVPAARIDAGLRVTASGVADPVGVAATARVMARALRPPAPVHLRAGPIAGGLRFGWTRRSRSGWGWTDGGEVPLGEEAERYRLTITPSAGSPRTVEIDAASYDYDAPAIAAIAADGAGAATSFAIALVQLGTFGASPDAASATFAANGDRA